MIAATRISAGWLVACAVAIAVLPREAHAQDAAAESLFNDGERMLKEGKVAEACDAFDASNKIEPRAGTLINIGLCREQNHQIASAWSAFKDALTRVKDPKKKEIAAAKVADLEPKLSYLTINVPDESRVDGLVVTRNGQNVDPVLWNRAVPVDGGTYKIAGHAPGHEEWSTSVDVPVESGKSAVEVPKFKEIVKLVTPPPVVKQEPIAPALPPPSDEPGMFTGKRKVAVGLAGVGVVAIVGGVVFGSQAKGKQDDAYKLCPDPAAPCAHGDEANDLISQGKSRATLANVSFGVGFVAIAGGAVLWFLGGPEHHEGRVSVIPKVGPATAGVDIGVRF